MKTVIISGRSGSGKSIVLNVLEDHGFYCIDNLPFSLVSGLHAQIHPQHKKIAIGIDTRNLPSDINEFEGIIKKLSTPENQCEIVFLDADDNTLLKRYSETRRKHPLTNKHTHLHDAIKHEKILLQPINEIANLRIDTSHLNTYQLSEAIRNTIVQRSNHGLLLLFQSFGFKFGVPMDSDYVFDVRCLPNPHWVNNLRTQNGLDADVQEFLLAQPETTKIINDIKNFLASWITQFESNHRNYMTISIGCTGGQHRSVYVTQQLAAYFGQPDKNVQIRHRELS